MLIRYCSKQLAKLSINFPPIWFYTKNNGNTNTIRWSFVDVPSSCKWIIGTTNLITIQSTTQSAPNNEVERNVKHDRICKQEKLLCSRKMLIFIIRNLFLIKLLFEMSWQHWNYSFESYGSLLKSYQATKETQHGWSILFFQRYKITGVFDACEKFV